MAVAVTLGDESCSVSQEPGSDSCAEVYHYMRSMMIGEENEVPILVPLCPSHSLCITLRQNHGLCGEMPAFYCKLEMVCEVWRILPK